MLNHKEHKGNEELNSIFFVSFVFFVVNKFFLPPLDATTFCCYEL